MQSTSFFQKALITGLNPSLQFIISKFDIDCEQDGSLLVNSLKRFLGEDVTYCQRCATIDDKVASRLYEIACRFMHLNPQFMKSMFLNKKYGEAWLRGFVLMMKGIKKFGIRSPFTPAGPFEVVWNFTYNCNLRCKHCYEDAGLYRPELSTKQAFEAIDYLSGISGVGLPALSFSGGEPLARADFFEVANYAKKKIPYISIATNGTLLTRRNVKKLKDVGIDYVEISIDGATSKVHERFRGVVGCFKKTMDGIQNCIKEGLDTCLASTAHRENYFEIFKIMELAKSLGVRFIHFNYVPTGRAKNHLDLDLTPKERFMILHKIGKELLELYLKSKSEREKTGKSKIKTDMFFSTCPQLSSVTRKLAQEAGSNFTVTAHYAAKKGVENIASFLGGCGSGRLYIGMEPNGDLKPCVFFPSNSQTIVGNILDGNFERVWDENSFFWTLRSREKLESYSMNGQIVGCGKCEDKYICGGCRARAYGYFDGNLNAADIGCINNELLWKKRKEQIAILT